LKNHRVLFRGILICLALPSQFATSQPTSSLLPLGERYAQVRGVRLWYKVAGHPIPGQAPVLYLHGGPGYNSYSFEKTIGAQLEQHMQMVYLDQRGSGRSDTAADGDYSVAAIVEDVEAMRRALNVPQFVLMGHSFGGMIALEFAAKYNEHVQSLIILDGIADMPAVTALSVKELSDRYPDVWKETEDRDSRKALAKALASGDACAISRANLAVIFDVQSKVHGFHNWQQFHDPKYREQQAALDEESGLEDRQKQRMPLWGKAYFSPTSTVACYRFAAFSRITMPALVIAGKYDYAIGAAQMKLLAERLPHAKYDEFPESGHFVYAEESGKFVSDVAQFLKEQRRHY
jgi:proline iminopeptidase